MTAGERKNLPVRGHTDAAREDLGGNDAVDLYTAPDGGGAHACIDRGDRWIDTTTDKYPFTYGAGLDQLGATVNNNISSHRWVTYCSQH